MIFSGNFDENTLINYDTDTEVYSSCSATLNDENYIIGGLNKNQVNKRQLILIWQVFKISKFIGCKLQKIRDLTFKYSSGACNSFLKFGILFCFGEDATRECHSLNISKNGTLTIKKEISSHYEHKKVLSLASYRGSPFVTGSYDPGHNKTELLNVAKMQWETNADFPAIR